MDLEIPDTKLFSIAEDLADKDTSSIMLSGSGARGERHPYSDLDFYCFADTLPEAEQGRYTLQLQAGMLVSVTTTTVSEQRMAFTQPERAIWVVPGIRQARILIDRRGSLTALKNEAEAFNWEPLRSAASAYASYTLMGNSEEAQKILGGFYLQDRDRVLYGTLGMVLGMVKAMAVWHGVLIESENSYFHQVQKAAGAQSTWSTIFRAAAGYEMSDVWERGKAGLRLYVETAALMDAAINPQDRETINYTREAMRQLLPDL